MALLDANIVEQLKAYFDKIEEPIEIAAFLNDSDKSKELDSFLQEVDAISNKVNYTRKTFGEDKSLEETAGITRPRSFTLLKGGKKTGINFYGILEGEQLEKVASVKKPLNIETFVSLSCTHCPEVVQALNLISVNNENITTSMVDSAVYFDEAKEKDIQAVPVVFINGKVSSVGEQTLEQLITTITNA